jgi:DHA3 family tetracycline resistance protein-like MFS transporter
VLIAGAGLGVPMIAGGGMLMALALFAALAMPEEGFRPTPRAERSTALGEMAATLRRGGGTVRRSPLLITILGIAVFAGAGSEGFDRLWAAHLLSDVRLPPLGHLAPVVWFGVIAVVARLLAIATTEVIRRYVATDTHAAATRVLFAIDALLVAGMVAFGLAANLALALGAYWTVSVLRQLRVPIYTAWLSRRIDPRVRATVLSMGSQLDSLGQVAGGPVIGLIGTLRGLRAALVATGVALSPALPLFVLAHRQGREPAAPASVEGAAAPEAR